MNAESLIGTVLGTCTLQQVIGQGGMGAVFLAQQLRPRRQVAVKVLLPITPLPPNQLSAFLERFRRETDAAASLEHPNIIPVYQYGEYNGLAYLVMPYISGGTLRDVMEQDGPLPLSEVVNYLEQLAEALDFAHEHGVIHRDIKPANVLLTPEGRLLLTDFGLVKVLAVRQKAQRHLTGPGAPVGTPDYMSPEQILGEQVDGRADLYSLGVILYQMVTGTMPFEGQTPMQIVSQHLHVAPQSPRLLRPNLPLAAEQVILRAMAKRPEDRYARGQDLATAFRDALTTIGTRRGTSLRSKDANPINSSTTALPEMASATYDTDGSSSGEQAMGLFRTGGLFDPAWQAAPSGAEPSTGTSFQIVPPTYTSPARPTGLLSAYKTAMSPQAKGTYPIAGTMGDRVLATPANTLSTTSTAQPAVLQHKSDVSLPALETTTEGLVLPKTTTEGLTLSKQRSSTSKSTKLTGPVKVVQVPIAGQPGRYVTGLLPVSPQEESHHPGLWQARLPVSTLKGIALVVTVLLILGAAVFWLSPTYLSRKVPTGSVTTTTTQANATTAANVDTILADPLSQNIHNWPTSPTTTASYAFTGGAYHITNLGDRGTAVVLQATSFNGPIAYTLTLQEIKGDDTSLNNSFGMILRSNVENKGGKLVSSFYSFEVVNASGGEYRFYKYDDSQAASGSAWTEIWHQPFNGTFHQGHSPNTIKILANSSKFTFTVDGKTIGHTQDNSIASGGVGMLVNLKGTEIAFSNLLITRS